MSENWDKEMKNTDDKNNVQKLCSWIINNPINGLTPKESERVLVTLLWAIHAPHDLEQFLTITDQLSDIVISLKRIVPKDINEIFKDIGIYIDDFIDLAAHLYEHEEQIFDVLGNVIESKGYEDRHPMHNKLGKYYIYTALMTESELGSKHVDEQLNLLKSVVLFYHILLIKDVFPPQSYLLNPSGIEYQPLANGRDKIILACRFIRHASFDSDSNLINQVDIFNTIDELYEDLESQKELKTEAYKKLHPLVSKPFSGSRKNRVGGNQAVGRGRWTFNGWKDGFVRGREGVFQEKLEEENSNILIINSPGQCEEEFEGGLTPDENPSEEEVIIYEDDNPHSKHILGKYQVKHLAMSNQHLPFEWDRNTNYELAELLKLFGSIIRESKDKLILETVCVAMIMLTTGEKLELVVSLFQYYISDIKVKHKTIAYIWNSEKLIGKWKIHPFLPKQSIRLNKQQRSYCEIHVRDKSIELPDYFNIGSFIRKVFSHEELNKSQGKKLFTRKHKIYRSTLNKILKTLSSENRINEHRIRSHLFKVISSEITGDVAEATLITGRYHPAAKNKLHYSSYPIDYLRSIYGSALSKMVSDVYKEGYNRPNLIVFKSEQAKFEVIGSDYSPRISSVQTAVRDLKALLKIGPSKKIQSEIIDYHNIFTLYTVLMTGFCTGYRAVKDPFPAVPDIDRETGLCIISDKDGADFYNSRLVWLQDVLIKQLDHYQEHRNVILSYLILNNNNIDKLSTLSDMFFLDDNMGVLPARPSTLKPLLENFLPLPINTNRRFLRSYLRIRGCPVEVVDAFMGHWSRGEEPWGRYSSLSYKQIIDELKIYLEPLIFELGFKSIRSRMYGF